MIKAARHVGRCVTTDGFVVRTVSPYTCLTVKSPGVQPDPTGLQMRLPEHQTPAGEWLLAEAKAALAQIKAQYPKAKEQAQNMKIGLTLRHGAHVCPVDDPEADVVLNPKFLIDALGRWPARIHWTTYLIVIATEDTQVWIACMRKG